MVSSTGTLQIVYTKSEQWNAPALAGSLRPRLVRQLTDRNDNVHIACSKPDEAIASRLRRPAIDQYYRLARRLRLKLELRSQRSAARRPQGHWRRTRDDGRSSNVVVQSVQELATRHLQLTDSSFLSSPTNPSIRLKVCQKYAKLSSTNRNSEQKMATWNLQRTDSSFLSSRKDWSMASRYAKSMPKILSTNPNLEVYYGTSELQSDFSDSLNGADATNEDLLNRQRPGCFPSDESSSFVGSRSATLLPSVATTTSSRARGSSPQVVTTATKQRRQSNGNLIVGGTKRAGSSSAESLRCAYKEAS